MTIKLYNTMSGEKEVFKPIDPNNVKIYLCGPTVYDFLHIGNFRGAITFNLIRNWLEHTGLKVTLVYNYTDIDDKIIKRAHEEGVAMSDISEKYIREFEKDFNTLGLRPHDHNPKVTDYIDCIIDVIETLVAKKRAYVIDGEVFYAIDSFSSYGKLSKKRLDELEAGQRVEVDQRKGNPYDFVLWKPSKGNEPSWDSPWGKGRPGWHIECSAMIRSILGETIDIHGGGIDLIFPHHENEIAQGEGCCDKTYANYWVHNNFINMGDEKMSKSLGNVMTARSFMEAYHPEILKYLFLSAHYRSMLSVTDEKILQTISALKRVYTAKETAEYLIDAIADDVDEDLAFNKVLKEFDKKIETAFNDDFNTANFISAVFEVVRIFNSKNLKNKKAKPSFKQIALSFKNWLDKYGQISALFYESSTEFLKRMDEILIKIKGIDMAQVNELLKERSAHRDAKNWEKADEVKEKLLAMGVELHDGQQKAWSVKI